MDLDCNSSSSASASVNDANGQSHSRYSLGSTRYEQQPYQNQQSYRQNGHRRGQPNHYQQHYQPNNDNYQQSHYQPNVRATHGERSNWRRPLSNQSSSSYIDNDNMQQNGQHQQRDRGYRGQAKHTNYGHKGQFQLPPRFAHKDKQNDHSQSNQSYQTSSTSTTNNNNNFRMNVDNNNSQERAITDDIRNTKHLNDLSVKFGKQVRVSSYTGRSDSHHSNRERLFANGRSINNGGRSFEPDFDEFRNSRSNKFRRNQHQEAQMKTTDVAKTGNESQREIMDELLRTAKYECIVCCEVINIADPTWNCGNCYNVFHLKCIQTWARSSNVSNESSSGGQNTNGNTNESDPDQASNPRSRGRNNVRGRRANHSNISNNNNNNSVGQWRCPTCQNVQNSFPYTYYCFCGKFKEPNVSNFYVPHSCGDPCTRPLSLFNAKLDGEALSQGVEMFVCSHRCTLLCHPGMCAPCNLKTERTCACGKTKMILNCVASVDELKCERICNKMLNCGKHFCFKQCHFGECGPCTVRQDVNCFCGKQTQTDLVCSAQVEQFSCGNICSKQLSCQLHNCTELCHSSDCSSCLYEPSIVKYCPCGQTPLDQILSGQQRKLCTDPIPECGKVCNRPLKCGTAADPHFCAALCHTGACPPCPLQTILKCKCGANSQKFDCKDITTDRFKCKRRCNKKLSCGRHKCLNECCTDKEHVCKQTCGRRLDCGQHSCSEPCHSVCKSCPNVIWTEVHCNCGAQVLYPPLPCGTQKPGCDKPCARVHSCGHAPSHQCHDDTNCPPCTEFVSRTCYGGHNVCNTVPCYQTGVSCGRFCSRPLSCAMHNCIKVCHPGECPPCNQRCTHSRQSCEHQCGLPCHQSTSASCPASLCKELVKVYCKCKFKVEDRPCHQVFDPKSYQAQMENLLSRYSLSLAEVKEMVHYNQQHQLTCDDKCAKNERTKGLASALGIENHPEPPRVKYSDFLKNEARANPQMILNIHDKFVLLLGKYKNSNLKTMCYNFPAMSRNNRQIVHCYAEHFGLKTESVDQEPNRSVTVTAIKTSTVPKMSLLEAINMDINQLRPKQSVVKVKTSSEENKNRQVIDYFNFDG